MQPCNPLGLIQEIGGVREPGWWVSKKDLGLEPLMLPLRGESGQARLPSVWLWKTFNHLLPLQIITKPPGCQPQLVLHRDPVWKGVWPLAGFREDLEQPGFAEVPGLVWAG